MAVCALTMLDGMEDEVTAAGGVFLLALALVLAWLSTHVADRGDHILGTILTVGAHASLISLGGHDSYSGGPPSTDTPEQQSPPPSQENKPEDGEAGADRGDVEGTGEGTAGMGPDLLLNIQVKKPHAGRNHHDDDDDDDEEEEEEDDEEDDDYEEEEEEDELDEEDEKVPKLFPVLSTMSSNTVPLLSSNTAAATTTTTTTIAVRLKFLNDTEEVAVLKPQDTVGLLKSKYFSGRERQIKLIYQGQLLQDPKRTLFSLNITHNSVIHCHVSQVLREASLEEPTLAGGGGSGAAPGVSGGLRAVGLVLNTSSLVVPVFVVMLAVVWYFRINYRQFFTAPATISLVGVTVFFSFLIFGMHSR